jgi:hypothetical protein
MGLGSPGGLCIISSMKRIKRRSLNIIIVIFFLNLIYSACGNNVAEKGIEYKNQSTDNISVTGSSSSVNENDESELQITSIPDTAVINPLTGLPVPNPDILNRRPVMVKVSNFPRIGRPHAGLSSADIVFDYFIGVGTNRFLALYYGQDAEKIGPVRSGRRVDAELVTMYEGVLAYGSADEDTDAVLVNTLGEYALSHLEADCPVFCGTDTHSVTGVFANSNAISTHVSTLGLENGRPDLPGMVFSEELPAGAVDADSVTILFNYQNRGEWRYDEPSGKFLRWIEFVENEEEGGEEFEMIPLVDRVNGEQLAFSNVIVLFARYNELAPTAHEIEIWANNTGMPAYLFRDGRMIAGEWKSVNDADPIQFFDSDGGPLALNPGNTWIAIMGMNSSIEIVQPGAWESFFFLP